MPAAVTAASGLAPRAAPILSCPPRAGLIRFANALSFCLAERDFRPMTTCPICQGDSIGSLASRDDVPVLQNHLLREEAVARAAVTGPLQMRDCLSCGYLWNEAFDSALVVYDPTYDNAQHHSDAFRRHLDERIEDIARCVGDEAVEILELGCGQGDFLRDLVRRLGPARVRRASGFDPAFDGTPIDSADLHAEIFDRAAAERFGIRPDIIIIRHMIEHVAAPLALFVEIAAALPRDKPVRLFVETPDADWIIRHQTSFDLYYEHCSKFSSAALALVLRKSGFVLERLTDCFGEQYLWAQARLAEPERAATLAGSETRFVERWREIVRSLGHPVYVWGAGAKGTTFALFVDPERRLLAGLIDINPAKQGLFVPKTGHPIVAPASLRNENPAALIVLNGNYADEIKAMVAEMGLACKVVVVEGDV